jgi:hypothetical protein
MKHDIDIFDGKDIDHRWDNDRNAQLLNIIYWGGTFGSFLKFFLDKFSLKSPDIDGEPFIDTGASHSTEIKYSNLIQRYHLSFINDNSGETGLPICLIVPKLAKHFLYLKKAQWSRARSRIQEFGSPDMLWQKAIGDMPVDLKPYAEEIIKLYDIRETAYFSWLPKFIVRDWYKLEFLTPSRDWYSYQFVEQMINHEFFKDQKVLQLDLESFFDWDTFMENIVELDDMFGISLDYDRKDEMKALFDKGLSLDSIRQECNLAEDVLTNQSDLRLDQLDVATEAFIYAEMEKANPNIQMPLTNRFFRDAEEIKQFIEHYPNWYRRPNPNIN